MEADYQSALQELRDFEFPLWATLLAHKDASLAEGMKLVRLEGPLADAPGMADLQPGLEQLFIPIHHPGSDVVVGVRSLSFAFEENHIRVVKIR